MKVVAERDENRRRDVDRLTVKVEALQAEIGGVRQENAVLRQQLEEHLDRYREWGRRLWMLIPVLVSAILALASGLIVTLATK